MNTKKNLFVPSYLDFKHFPRLRCVVPDRVYPPLCFLADVGTENCNIVTSDSQRAHTTIAILTFPLACSAEEGGPRDGFSMHVVFQQTFGFHRLEGGAQNEN